MSPPDLSALAPAKVNLTLHLTGLRDDGYHLLHSLVVFADMGDSLTVAPDDNLCLTVSGPMANGVPTDGRNLVLRAARRLRDLRQVSKGASIHLEKHLPHGAGIGGGSSDAAAAIRLLARLWSVPPLTAPEALPLGADLPVCLCAPAPTVMRGIGEDLVPAPPLPQGWLVLVNPGIHVPTAEVFKDHDRLFGFTQPWIERLDNDMRLTPDRFARWLKSQRNDLTKVVLADHFAPAVGDILARLQGTGARHADMSGSGSTCWGWYDTIADAHTAAAAVSADCPEYWVRAARVLDAKDTL
ncbi:MAG: 4-(cytidine 5'-diphospho)-2-C-methyl-D-erythritol kinase [Gemmobacter sp.]|nr:4-(cytidine 5'-diphospho)-2-C-methyl-D-erythritol kinase [Gemmobacter sp.]